MPNLSMFRRICYAAARQTGGEVTEFRISDKPTPNFHQGIVSYDDREVAVVWVRDSALLAIAVPRSLEPTQVQNSGPLAFIDLPHLAVALAEFSEFRVLTVRELAGPIDAAEWPTISPDDLRYWRPGSLGEALFNYWD